MRLIDADELIDLIKERNCGFCRDNDNRHNNWHCRECEYNEVMSNIEDAPTIEAEPRKHGRWINIKVSTTGESSAECSECGAIVHTTFTSTVNYCPNCGARMDEVEE